MEPLTYIIPELLDRIPKNLVFHTNWVDSVNLSTILGIAPEIHTTFLPEENDGREMLGYKGKLGYSDDPTSSTMIITNRKSRIY